MLSISIVRINWQKFLIFKVKIVFWNHLVKIKNYLLKSNVRSKQEHRVVLCCNYKSIIGLFCSNFLFVTNGKRRSQEFDWKIISCYNFLGDIIHHYQGNRIHSNLNISDKWNFASSMIFHFYQSIDIPLMDWIWIEKSFKDLRFPNFINF